MDSTDASNSKYKFDSLFLLEKVRHRQSIEDYSLKEKLRQTELEKLRKIVRYYQIVSILLSSIILFELFRRLLNFMAKRGKNNRDIILEVARRNTEPNIQIFSKKWVVVGESAIGKSHLRSGKPCQDRNFFHSLGKNWGIAIVCDGAGSAEHSDIGAEFICHTEMPNLLLELIKNESWIENNKLPDISDWHSKATAIFEEAFTSLSDLANKKNVDITSLACTCIAVIYSPIGILIAHIGDGRAAFCNENGEWNSIMIPHKGEESNQTIFISSKTWHQNSDFRMSGVTVPECRVITEKPTAFVLMSDGCEQHSFECSLVDPVSGSWSDPNRPYERFFSPLIQTLSDMASSPNSTDLQEPWKKFLEIGTPGLKNESDDKTMILGILK
ncbi:PP2C family serine/threonine-protein phosphatase [Dyadobacter bucti]|uniref:PP2C family serine/threonine-protein phosphatase n=1 Tax=Dyadobacter bucti TaxID=2572203 RepID=UPI0011083729|nr:PP2C family serine/threonine-protein phosphatase [Dyadobacter bucti]